MLEDTKYLQTFIRNEFWTTSIDDAYKAWRYTGDLLFKNFEACHFKAVIDDVNAYCSAVDVTEGSIDDEWSKYNYGETDSTAPRCSSKAVVSGLQKNMFALIT